MNRPICEFIDNYLASAPTRVHMPGHKGIGPMGIEARDLTEITGADVLYQANGIILESENNAASLFGSGKTVYSTEGSSLSIRAMLYMVAMYAAQHDQKPLIFAARNAHKVFITASALLDLPIHWLYPRISESIVSCHITPDLLEEELRCAQVLPTAVYITSPDYLGNIADIAALSDVCHQYGVLLIVDNAHGAYLKFLPEDCHPLSLGADLCCDSAHKTLPVLTGGGYLHISKKAPKFFFENANRAMDLFASTSPSYLILQSLDEANDYLSGNYKNQLEKAVSLWDTFREELRERGYTLTGNEPLKIAILAKAFGYTGTQLAELLEARHIYCEFYDPDYLVMMLPVENAEAVYAALSTALLPIQHRSPITELPPSLTHPVQEVPAHEALYRASVTIPVKDAKDRVMASPTLSCPPAIPIVSCGEKIDDLAIRLMNYYGIDTVQVLN